MTSELKITSWSGVKRDALTPNEIEAALKSTPGWALEAGAIEKTFRFNNYFETMAFVNALVLIAHKTDHHPDLSVHYNHCVVRFNTHDVSGLSETDFECARAANALLS
jgi:4a-hydroxytetrahydrobiopterin dehydratase